MSQDFIHTKEALDKIAKIVCKEKQAEIEKLRKYIEELGKEGRRLSMEYSYMGIGGPHKNLSSDLPHDIFDFLQSI